MTVCLANFAARSRAIIMVSDKAVSYGDDDSAMPLVSDTGARKFLRIGNTFWYALMAGDPTFAIQTVDGVNGIIENRPDLPDSLSGMMAAFKAAYQQRRDTLVEDLVLKPRLLSKELFVERGKDIQPLDQEFFFGVSAEAKELRTNSTILVCGFDKQNIPHIFSVSNPAKVANHDLTGFHAIGIGAPSALARLLTLEAAKEDELEKSLYQSFDAKVNAELMPSVGYNWDAEILVPGVPAIPVPKPIINVIERIYGNFPLTPFDGRTGISGKQKTKYAKALGRFAVQTLAKAKPFMQPRQSKPRKPKSKQ